MEKRNLQNLLFRAVELVGLIQKDSLMGDMGNNKGKYGCGGASDIVTVADLKSEEALRAFFKLQLPDYNILGEEFGGSYNGNGKLIVIDPLDCSKSYKERLPNFGPIIGIYENGENVAGIEYNVLKELKYVTIKDGKFERIGDEEDIPKDAIYLEGRVPGDDSFAHKLAVFVKEEFPDNPLVINSQNVLNKARVFDGKWKVFFHAGLARHDIATVPIFAKLTGVKATDHNGVPYKFLNPEMEIKKYQTGRKECIYTNPIVVSHPDYHERFLKVLSQFKKELDMKQNPDNAMFAVS